MRSTQTAGPSRDLGPSHERLARAEAEVQAAVDRLEGREVQRPRASSASSSGRPPVSPARAAERAMLQRAGEMLLSSGEAKKTIGASPFSQFEASGGGCQCVICLQEITRSEFTEGFSIYVTPCAGRHVLHRACAEEWFAKKDACPMCRESIPQSHQPKMPARKPSRRGKSAPRPKFGTEAHEAQAKERGAADSLQKIMRSLERGRTSAKRR